MRRLSENEKSWGPVSVGTWNSSFSARISSGDDESPGTHFLITGFRFALRIKLPDFLKPCGKFGEWETEYGFSLSKEGNGYDFLQLFYGGQHEYDGPKNRKSWFIPWKQWTHVRTSIYTPDGTHFADEEKAQWREFFGLREKCPKAEFRIRDYDGEEIVATCTIEEREWHRGEKPFAWLKYFCAPKIRRSLDIKFSSEMGPEKGSWKGGTIGHGIDMLPGETVHQAFERYCTLEKRSKYRSYFVTFLGPASPQTAKPV